MKFLGKTPLTAAVKQAAEALKYTEDKATVILITDGLETCEADPCALGKELEAVRRRFHRPCRRLRPDGGGGQAGRLPRRKHRRQIHPGSDAGALKDALAETVAVAPAPAPEPAPGRRTPAPAPEPAKPGVQFQPERGHGRRRRRRSPMPAMPGRSTRPSPTARRASASPPNTTPTRATLEPGDYIVVARLGEASVEQQVKIEAGQVDKPVFVLNAGTLIVRPRPSEGADISDGATVVDRLSRRRRPGDQLRRDEDRPAGRRAEADRQDRPGRGHRDGAARRRPDRREGHHRRRRPRRRSTPSTSSGGDKVDASGLRLKIVKATKKIDGTRDEVANAYGPDAQVRPAARRLCRDRAWIRPQRRAAVQHHAPVRPRTSRSSSTPACWPSPRPAPRTIEVFEAKKDIQGNRKAFGYAYDEKHCRRRCRPATMSSSPTMRRRQAARRKAPVTRQGRRADRSHGRSSFA